MTKKTPVITVCTSANFYRQAVDIQEELEKAGFKVILPTTAERMKESGDFDASHYRTWFGDPNDYHKKTALMRGHFAEVEKADIVLVLNYEKNGRANYIGGNVLMEMAVAFFLNKPIYIFNQIPEESAYLEEIIGMNPVVLGGKLGGLIDVGRRN